MSPSKESRRSQSADGRDEAEMFQERATYTTHAVDEDSMENGGATHAKTGSEEEDQGKKRPRNEGRKAIRWDMIHDDGHCRRGGVKDRIFDSAE